MDPFADNAGAQPAKTTRHTITGATQHVVPPVLMVEREQKPILARAFPEWSSINPDQPSRYESTGYILYNDPQDSSQSGQLQVPASQPKKSPSILRRLTKKVRNSSISKSVLPSPRHAEGGEYSNLEDDDGEAVHYDLSTLTGLGFELEEMSPVQTPTPQTEDTQYLGASSALEGYAMRRSARAKSIGDGMREVRTKLTRDPSRVRSRDDAVARSTTVKNAVQRHKTVRHIGQNLAQEQNGIVAINEGIDISSLEGHQPTLRSSDTFDNMIPTANVGAEENQSYFFPRGDIPDWKPISMSKVYILLLTVSALTLAGVQEYMCRWSFKEEKATSGILAFDEVADTTIIEFFSWKYLPTMVAIIYAVMFSIMDFDVRRLEPYYQLSQPHGATAAASLNLDHITTFQYFVPIRAFRLKQWAVFVSTIGNIAASTIAPALQNPSIDFQPNPNCDNEGVCPSGQERYWVRISPVWSRLLTATYVFVAFLTIILYIQLRRKSGLLSDPKGIAGIASMATKSHILHDFVGTDETTRGEIHRKLAHRRYVLYQSSIWQGEWSPAKERTQESEERLRSPHPFLLQLKPGTFLIAYMVFGLIGIPIIGLTDARKIPNTVPWLPVLLATVLKLLFSTFEADVRLIEPFYRLALGNARPETSLTLDYQSSVYGYMPFKAMFNGHWLVMCVGFSSIALDILTVTVSSFSVNSEVFLHPTFKPPTSPNNSTGEMSNESETLISFWVSLGLSMTILVSVIATTAMVYVRRSRPFLPREPSTIASVLAFIHASRMLDDFIGTEYLSSREMEGRLKKINKTYGLGWFIGRDGKRHCAVDEGSMITPYKHGQSYHRAVGAMSATIGEDPGWEYYSNSHHQHHV